MKDLKDQAELEDALLAITEDRTTASIIKSKETNQYMRKKF